MAASSNGYLKEFAEVGLAAVAPGADFSPIASELATLAARLDRFPRVLSHRDYHRENLFIQDGPRIRVIDFQDALMAPAAQDLAVLLTTRDTDDVITPAIERRILYFYCAGIARRGAPALDAAEFMLSYRLCVLQHALKMIGRFENFERNGKTGYRQYIPHALDKRAGCSLRCTPTSQNSPPRWCHESARTRGRDGRAASTAD